MPFPDKKSVFRRLLTRFLLISLIPLTVLASLAIIYSTQVSINEIKRKLSRNANEASELLNSELLKYAKSVEKFSRDDELVEFLAATAHDSNWVKQLNQKIYMIMAERAGKLDMHVADSSGHFILSTSPAPREFLTDKNWGIFRAVNSSADPIIYATSFTKGVRNEDMGLVIGCRVVRGQKCFGYVFLSIPRSVIADIMFDSNADFAAQHIVYDAQSFVVLNEVMPQNVAFLSGDYRDTFKSSPGNAAVYEANGNSQMIFSKSGIGGLFVASNVSVDLIQRYSRQLAALLLGIVVVMIAICVWSSQYMAKKIVQPIHTICDAMRVIERGDLGMRVSISTGDEFETMAKGLNDMVGKLAEQFKTNLDRQNRLRLAEYKNLQAQISPHFLSNTLESIKWLARLHLYSDIETIVEKLGVLLKSGMVFKKDMIALGDELNAVESYLTIQKIRYEDRFKAIIDVPAEMLACQVPNLVIQPIVENAIVHGVEKQLGFVTVSIRAWHEDDLLRISISDDGAGMDEDVLTSLLDGEHMKAERESIGLVNVHRRLKLYFGEAYGIDIVSREGAGTSVTVNMPYSI